MRLPRVFSLMTIRTRALWLVGLMFVIFVGVSAGGVLYTSGVDERAGRQQDADMCHLLAALLPVDGPAPSPGGPLEAQRRAVAEYRARRC